jgi:hypothetical protein
MTDLLTDTRFTRRRFVEGGGALVVGFSLLGAATAGTASAAAHRGDVAGPPDPDQVDSWLEIHPDNTATDNF